MGRSIVLHHAQALKPCTCKAVQNCGELQFLPYFPQLYTYITSTPPPLTTTCTCIYTTEYAPVPHSLHTCIYTQLQIPQNNRRRRVKEMMYNTAQMQSITNARYERVCAFEETRLRVHRNAFARSPKHVCALNKTRLSGPNERVRTM